MYLTCTRTLNVSDVHTPDTCLNLSAVCTPTLTHYIPRMVTHGSVHTLETRIWEQKHILSNCKRKVRSARARTPTADANRPLDNHTFGVGDSTNIVEDKDAPPAARASRLHDPIVTRSITPSIHVMPLRKLSAKLHIIPRQRVRDLPPCTHGHLSLQACCHGGIVTSPATLPPGQDQDA